MFIQILRQGFYKSLRQALFNTLLVSTCFILKIYVLAHIHNSFLRRTHRSNLLKMASNLTSADAGAASTPDANAGAASTPDDEVVVVKKKNEGVF